MFGDVENRSGIRKKTVTGRRRTPRRVPGVILHDFGAKMEVKSLQKGGKMRSKFEAKKRMQKNRKKGPGLQLGIGLHGLAEAAGEVRRASLRDR